MAAKNLYVGVEIDGNTIDGTVQELHDLLSGVTDEGWLMVGELQLKVKIVRVSQRGL